MKKTLPSSGILPGCTLFHPWHLPAFIKPLRGGTRRLFRAGLLAACCLFAASYVQAQVPITYYDFDVNTARTTGENVVEQQVNTGGSSITKGGGSSITYNSGAGVYNGGNATGRCISATNWSTTAADPGTAATTYFQFTANAAGFSGMQVGFEAQATSGAPTRVGVLYSTDGVTFAKATTAPKVVTASWQPIIFYDLPAAADNASSLTIRIYFYGAGNATNRVDVDNIGVLAATLHAGTKTLLDYDELNESLIPGTSVNYPWNNFTVTGAGTQATMVSSLNIYGTLAVNNGAILDCGAGVVSGGAAFGFGNGTFVLNAGGRLKTAHAAGIATSGNTGAIQLGLRTFSAGAHYEYNGTANQVTGSGLPTALTGSLTIANTGTTYKTVTLDAVRTIAAGGALYLGSGIFAAGTNLTMAAGSTLTRAEGTITGTPANSANIVYTGNSKTAGVELGTSLANLQISLTGGQSLTMGANRTVTGSLNLASGTLLTGTYTLTVPGVFSRTAGTINALLGGVVLNGAAAQTIPAGLFESGIGTFTVNNSAGVTTGDLTVTNLVLTAGTVSLGTSVLTITGGISRTTGILNASSATIEYRGTGAQTIAPAAFSGAIGSLVLANNSGVSASGGLTVNNQLHLSAGAFSAGAFTHSFKGNLVRTSGSLAATNATIQFNGTAVQTIGSGIFSAPIAQVVVNNSAGITLSADLTVSTGLTLTAGTLQLDNAALTIGGTLTRTGGAINAAAGTVALTGSTAQNLGAGLFSGSIRQLTIQNSAGVSTAASLTVGHTLNLTAGTFSIGTTTLTVNGTISRTAGAIDAATGTVAFGGSSAQTITAGAFTGNLNHLIINNPQGVSTNSNLTLIGNLALQGGALAIGSHSLTIKGNISGTGGWISAATGTILFTGSSAQDIAAGTIGTAIGSLTLNNSAGLTTAANLTVNNNLALTAGTLSIGNTVLTLNGSISRTAGSVQASSGTVVFSGSSAQTLPANAFSTAFHHLTLDNYFGLSTTASQTVNGTLTLNAGLFNVGATTLTLNGNVARVAGSINASAANVVFSGSAGQIIDADAFSGGMVNLTVANSAGVNTSSDATITGTLTLTAGTYNIGTSVHTLTGTIIRTGGTLNAASGTLVFNGTSAQQIPAGAVSTAIRNLTVNNAAGLTINTNHTVSTALQLQAGPLVLNDRTLTLTGTLSGSGNLRGSPASALLVAAAGALGTLNFDQTTDGTTNALASLSMASGSATLGTRLNLYTVLNVAGGTFDAAGKNIVLKSSAANTARVAPVTGTINGASNVTVERWYPNNGRKYRLVTAGVTTTTSIRANWMEGGMNTAFCSTCNVNPLPGYGTHITGAGGNNHGFDVTSTNNTSLFTYNPGTGNWTAVTSTNGTLNAGTPYLIFLRGDRAVDMTASGNIPVLLPGSGTTLRATGTLPVGNRTVSAIAAAGKNTLVSNPYPSPISWATIYSNNSAGFENFYNYFEPKIGQRGSYVTVTNYGLNNNVNSTATEQIQPGQAFFVTTRTGAAPTQFLMREQDKSTTSNINVFRTPLNHIQKFYISLNFTETNGQKFNADGVLAAYGPQFSNNVDADDAVQISAWDEDIAILRQGKALSIETRTALLETDTIPLTLARLKAGQRYEWQFTPKDLLSAASSGFLVDNHLKKRTAISLTDTTFVPFTITTEPGSNAANRFYVVFKPELSLLPVTFMALKAYRKPGMQPVTIEWQTANESGLSSYGVQRSADGRQFRTIGTVQPKNGAANGYVFTDSNPVPGVNYYRLQGLEQNGASRYSHTVMIRNGGGEPFALFPNPLNGSGLGLQLGALPKGSYHLLLCNSTGAQVFSTRLAWGGGTGTQVLQLPDTLPAGAYTATLTGEGQQYMVLLLKE